MESLRGIRPRRGPSTALSLGGMSGGLFRGRVGIAIDQLSRGFCWRRARTSFMIRPDTFQSWI